jgi:membrane associated rhomboid family serine protease
MFPLRDDNPTKKMPVVTLALIAINTGIFIGLLLAGDAAYEATIYKYGATPNRILAGQDLHTLVTSIFLHGGILHIFGNMLYLWIFGDNVEDALGRKKFILFYLGSGVIASLAHVAFNSTSSIPTIGASGAISAILGAYILIYPRAHILTLVGFYGVGTMVAIPALALLGFWFVLQFLEMSVVWVTSASAEVAYWAHIAGFIAGILLILPFWLKLRKRRRLERSSRYRIKFTW